MIYQGIQSSGTILITSGIAITAPYHMEGINVFDYTDVPEPIITVVASGNLDGLDTLPPGTKVQLYACAIPAGTTGPTDTTGLISGYVNC